MESTIKPSTDTACPQQSIPMSLIHTVERPFCFANPECPCHEDTDEVNKVNQYYQNGLMTASEATKSIKGE